MKCTFISGQYILNPEKGELVFTSIALKSDTLEKLYEIKPKLQKSVIKSVGVKNSNTGSVSENDAFCDILKLLQQTENNILVGSSEDNIWEILEKLKISDQIKTYKAITHYTWLSRIEKWVHDMFLHNVVFHIEVYDNSNWHVLIFPSLLTCFFIMCFFNYGCW